MTEKLLGYTFTVPPTVFNPTDYISSKIFAEFIQTLDLKNKRVLDMGSGSGVVSIFAAAIGAKCVAVDINPAAVKAIIQNTEANQLSGSITAVQSDLFENIKGESFDVIFFNPPYYTGEPVNDLERAFKGGNELEVVTKFLSHAKAHLNNEGVIYFIVSSDMNMAKTDLKWLNASFEKKGYKYQIIKEITRFFETFYIIKLVVNLE